MADKDSIDDMLDSEDPCLVIPDSQTEGSISEHITEPEGRVKRLWDLAALRNISTSPVLDVIRAEGKDQRSYLQESNSQQKQETTSRLQESMEDRNKEEKEEDDFSPTQEDLFNEPRIAGRMDRMICTPSATIASLHLSQGDVPETTSDEIGTPSMVLSDGSMLIVSSSPTEPSTKEGKVSSFEEKKSAVSEREDVQLPAWQQALNKSHHSILSCDSTSSSSKSKENSSSSLSNSVSVSEGAPQFWQDVQLTTSKSGSASADKANKVSASESSSKSNQDQNEQSFKNLQKDNLEESHQSSKAKEKKVRTSNISSSQDWSLHLTPSQSETESQGAVLALETVLRRNPNEMEQRLSERKDQKESFQSQEDVEEADGKCAVNSVEIVEISYKIPSGTEISSELGDTNKNPGENKQVRNISGNPDVSGDRGQPMDAGPGGHSGGHQVKERNHQHSHSERTKEASTDPSGVGVQQERDGTPVDNANEGSKDNLAEASTSQVSETSFHLNVPKNGADFQRDQVSWFLKEQEHSRTPRHSTPIGIDESDLQNSPNSENKQTKRTDLSNGDNRSILTVGLEPDHDPAGESMEAIFHLDFPNSTKEDLKVLKESPVKQNDSIFAKVQASTSLTKNLHVHFTNEPDTQGDENLFVMEEKNTSRNSSTDTIPIGYSGETESYAVVELQANEPLKTNDRGNNQPAVVTTYPDEHALPNSAVVTSETRPYSFTQLRDPYEFTESQSSRTPVNLRDTRSRTRSGEKEEERKKKSDAITTTSKETEPRTRPRRAAKSPKTHTPPRRRKSASKDKESENPHEKNGSGKQNTDRNRTKSVRVQEHSHRKDKSREGSTSSSGENREPNDSRVEESSAPHVVKYYRVPVWLRRKEVYEYGVLVSIDETEIKRDIPHLERKEESYNLPPLSPPKSTSSVTSGSLADVSSMGSRSSSNTGSLQKSLSVTSSKSSTTTSGRSDTSPTKTPSPVALTRSRSGNAFQQIPEEPSTTTLSFEETHNTSISFSKTNNALIPNSSELNDRVSELPEKIRVDESQEDITSSVGKALAESVHAQVGSSEESDAFTPEGRKQKSGAGAGIPHEIISPETREEEGDKTPQKDNQGRTDELSDKMGIASTSTGSHRSFENLSVIAEASRSDLDMSSLMADDETSLDMKRQQPKKSRKLSAKKKKHEDASHLGNVPAAPEKPKMRNNLPASVTLFWTSLRSKGSSPVSGFILESKEVSGKTWSRVTDTNITETRYILVGFKGGEEVQYRVIAVNNEGSSQPSLPSNILKVPSKALCPPVPPSPKPDILDNPPSASVTAQDMSLDSTATVQAETRVLTRWTDGYFYPGRVKEWIASERYVVEFDDGDKREVDRRDIINKDWLSKGQSVLAKEENCEFYSKGVVVGYYHDKSKEESGYAIENSKHQTVRIPRKNIILNKMQGSTLLSTSSSSSCGTSSGDISLGNVVSGKRRSMNQSLSSLTPENSTAISSSKPTRTPPEVDPSSTPRSSAKRKILPTNGKDAREVPAKKKLTLTSSPVCASPEVGAVRPSPRKRPHPESTDAEPPSKASHIDQDAEISRHVGCIPKSKTLFKGLAFLITQGETKLQHEISSNDSIHEEQPQVPFRKEYAILQIEKGGGLVLKDFDKSQRIKQKLLLIANTHCRTKKYFQALAAGIPCINHVWLRDCCNMNQRLPEQSYYLPAGDSLEELETNPVEWLPNRPSVLKGKNIMVVSDHEGMRDVWRSILIAAGCNMVSRVPPGLDDDEDTCTPFLCDYIVTDPTCPKHILQKGEKLGIPIVSVEWVIQCLINGKTVRPDSHQRYIWSYRERPPR